MLAREVIVKLLAFTFAMVVVPIGSYFVTVNTIYRGEECPSVESCWCRPNVISSATRSLVSHA